MPALAKSSVGSSCGITDELRTNWCSYLLAKKSMNALRTSRYDFDCSDILSNSVMQSGSRQDRKWWIYVSGLKCVQHPVQSCVGVDSAGAVAPHWVEIAQWCNPPVDFVIATALSVA